MKNQRPDPPPPPSGLLGLVLILFLVVFIPLFAAYNEAASFNRFTTGPKATMWDALFVELRVEAQR